MMKLYKFGFALGIAVLAGAGTASAQQVYKVGIADAPYGFMDAKANAPQGYSVDVINAIAKDAGIKVEFVYFANFGDVIPALLAKKIDIDGADTTITDKRKAMGIDFSDEYCRFAEGMLVQKSDGTPYKSFDELKGQVVATLAGTTYEDGLKKLGGFKELKTYPAEEEFAKAISAGEVKAAMDDSTSAAYLLQQGKYPDVKLAGTYVPIHVDAGGIAVLRGDAVLAKINAALGKLKADGTLKTIATKWGVNAPM